MSLITWNPEDKHSDIVLTNNNLTAQNSSGATGYLVVRATEGKSFGKWYWETIIEGNIRVDSQGVGIAPIDTTLNLGSNVAGFTKEYVYVLGGWRYHNKTWTYYGVPANVEDTIGVCLDLDNAEISFSINGVDMGIAYQIDLNSIKVYYPIIVIWGYNKMTTNFGATPFKYEMPEGYLPYDLNNADWLTPNKYLLKQGNKILTIESDVLVDTELQEPLTRLDFEELGFNNLDLLLGKDLSNTTLLINTSTTTPTVNIKAVPKSQIIIPTGDILLKMLDKIYNFTLYSNKNSGGNIKIIFSVDEGVNWLTYNLDTGEFEEIDINQTTGVKENGMDPDTFNSIKERWNEVILNSKIRFAYYIELESINDIAEIDKLEIEMDMHGRWRKAGHGKDYHYKYDNEHLYVSFFKDGSYKINYQR